MNALVPINTAPAFSMSDIERVAIAIAKGGLFGSKDPNAVLTLCLLAQAEGQHPAVVFRDYHIIQGKPAKKADAMLRDFINAGGAVEWHQLDDTKADATFTHPSGKARIDWTIARAKQAGIANPMWAKYPRQMLRSRVISEGVRTVYPGATSGLYEVGEVQDIAAETPAQAIPQAEFVETPEPANNGPAPREKLEGGPYTSKSALQGALRAYALKLGECLTSKALMELQTGYAATLEQARRYIPKWLDGDPDNEDSQGLTVIALNRKALCDLLDDMRTCETTAGMDAWMKANGDSVDGLSDADRRTFEAEWEKHGSARLLVAQSVA